MSALICLKYCINYFNDSTEDMKRTRKLEVTESNAEINSFFFNLLILTKNVYLNRC